METIPYREKVHACIHPETYKYFFPKDMVLDVWARLESRYGSIKRNPHFRTMEIYAKVLIFRSTFLANPITVFRLRRCSADDVADFHQLVGYEG